MGLLCGFEGQDGVGDSRYMLPGDWAGTGGARVKGLLRAGIVVRRCRRKVVRALCSAITYVASPSLACSISRLSAPVAARSRQSIW